MKYKIKTLNVISPKGLELLDSKYEIKDFENPDGIVVRSQKMHDMVFPKDLKYIGRAGAGVNNIPVQKCSEAGIVVSNAPGANANAVKELVIFSLLASSRKLIEAVNWVNNIEDGDIVNLVESNKKKFAGPEIYGKKIGIIGLGAIGVLVANTAKDLGMKVYGYDPFITVQNAWGIESQVHKIESAEEIFRTCDYVSIHVPFNENTKNYINEDLLEKAKNGIVVLNLARGGIVDNKAMKKALDSGLVSYYICDFPDEDTINMKNTINIPHLGASTPESEENSAKMVVVQMMDYLENGNIKNSVNFPDCNMGICNSINRVTVLHKNIPNMIRQITKVLAENHVNISDLLNRNKGEWAYTMIDVDSKVEEDLVEKFLEIEGVARARILKGNK